MSATDSFQKGWCLVMAMWGTKYKASHVNVLVQSVRRHAPECTSAVLVTDRLREDIDPFVIQTPIPPQFDRPEFFRLGYPVKLSVFAAPTLPPDIRCVFVDLDTLIVGDLTRLAMRVETHDALFMLPPATIGFNSISRWLYKITRGRKYRTGNSSILAFSSTGGRKLAATYLRLWEDQSTHNERRMRIDDSFVSWFGQATLRDVPTSDGVMFRREFLSRVPFWPRIKTRLPNVVARRARVAAITLNGMDYKPDVLLNLKENALIEDTKGRRGLWSEKHMGSLFTRIQQLCREIVDRTE